MPSNSLPIWALPAAGATLGATAGLLGSINIDDPRVTPSIKAKKLLRCLILGGTAGLGLEGMRQGGKVVLDNMKTGSVHRGGLLRYLLVKRATEENPAPHAETTKTNESWFSGSTAGLPNHYLVGGGLGALGGVTLYHLLNDKKKRRASGYLGSALAGLGIGASGAGLYRFSKGLWNTDNPNKAEKGNSGVNPARTVDPRTGVNRAKRNDEVTLEDRQIAVDQAWARREMELEHAGKSKSEIAAAKQEFYDLDERSGAFVPIGRPGSIINHYNDTGRTLAREERRDDADLKQYYEDRAKGIHHRDGVVDSREGAMYRLEREKAEDNYGRSGGGYAQAHETPTEGSAEERRSNMRADYTQAVSNYNFKANDAEKADYVQKQYDYWVSKYGPEEANIMRDNFDGILAYQKTIEDSNKIALERVQGPWDGWHRWVYGLNKGYGVVDSNSHAYRSQLIARTNRNNEINRVLNLMFK